MKPERTKEEILSDLTGIPIYRLLADDNGEYITKSGALKAMEEYRQSSPVNPSSPTVKESETELWMEFYNALDEAARDVDSYDFGLPRSGAEDIISKLKERFSLTRKPLDR